MLSLPEPLCRGVLMVNTAAGVCVCSFCAMVANARGVLRNENMLSHMDFSGSTGDSIFYRDNQMMHHQLHLTCWQINAGGHTYELISQSQVLMAKGESEFFPTFASGKDYHFPPFPPCQMGVNWVRCIFWARCSVPLKSG